VNEPFDWLREQLGDDYQAALMADVNPAPRARRGTPARPARRQPQREQAMPFGSIVDFGRMAAGAGAASQGSHLQNMANMTMAGIGRENQSRVAQLREQRRMMQDQQMKEMDLQELLIRLQHEREMAEKQMKYASYLDDKKRGVVSSTKWRGLFD
jgi:hypothetical protein